MKALGKENCAKLFRGHDPVEVLKGLAASDPKYGNFIFGPIVNPNPGEVTHATAQGIGNGAPIPIGNGASISTSASVLITLNMMIGSNFGDGRRQESAATLLHELGHVFDKLYGPNSTDIVSDGENLKQSQANTKTIKDNCF